MGNAASSSQGEEDDYYSDEEEDPDELHEESEGVKEPQSSTLPQKEEDAEDDTDTESMVSIPTTPDALMMTPQTQEYHPHAPEYTHVIDDPFDGIETLGYRVLGVQPNSPAAHAGLVSFFDFLIGVNQQMLLGSGADLQPGQEYEDIDLPAFLHAHLNVECEFCTYTK
jgi:hypothetical protein